VSKPVIFNSEFEKISLSAQELIKRLLVKDPTKRLTCAEAINNVWFAEMEQIKPNAAVHIDPSVIDRLRTYNGTSLLKREAMSILVKMLNPNQIGHLLQIFHAIDKDNTGKLSLMIFRDDQYRGVAGSALAGRIQKHFGGSETGHGQS
jgi:calcium-dependent protein kinase